LVKEARIAQRPADMARSEPDLWVVNYAGETQGEIRGSPKYSASVRHATIVVRVISRVPPQQIGSKQVTTVIQFVFQGAVKRSGVIRIRRRTLLRTWGRNPRWQDRHRSAIRFAATANEAAGPPSDPGGALFAVEGGFKPPVAATSPPRAVEFISGFSGADADAESAVSFSAGSTLAVTRFFA
jgi:hypothetical protein